MSVPRWGVHEGIKYTPKRSILKICPICKNLFLQNYKGNKKYCKEMCAYEAKKTMQKDIDKKKIANRDLFEHANYMMKFRHDNPTVKKIQVGTDYVPKPKLRADGSKDWNAFHRLLQGKLNKFGMV